MDKYRSLTWTKDLPPLLADDAPSLRGYHQTLLIVSNRMSTSGLRDASVTAGRAHSHEFGVLLGAFISRLDIQHDWKFREQPGAHYSANTAGTCPDGFSPAFRPGSVVVKSLAASPANFRRE